MTDARQIAKLLLRKYPNPSIALTFSNPLELLVAAILSAQCTDVRVNEVTPRLFKRYRSAGDYAGADIREFEEEIRPTGFYRSKAKTVIACCRKIVEDFAAEVPGRLEDLVTLPGVGRKTANLVLGSAFNRQAMAVDIHVLRASKRLGLTRHNDPDQVEEELVGQFPRRRLTAINLALILHGRKTCKAKKPACPECVLRPLCPWNEKTTT